MSFLQIAHQVLFERFVLRHKIAVVSVLLLVVLLGQRLHAARAELVTERAVAGDGVCVCRCGEDIACIGCVVNTSRTCQSASRVRRTRLRLSAAVQPVV